MPNPFFYGGRIENPDDFIGRKAELRRIFSALETNHTGQVQHYSIVAPRRMGKSSLLYHVTQIFPAYLQNPEKYRFVYLNLDDARCHTRPGLLSHILDRLKIAHPRRPSLVDFQERIERAQKREHFWPVLCLDEFEHLTRRKDEFPDEFFDAWRTMGSNNHLSFLTASKATLKQLAEQDGLTSPFFSIFQILELGEFSGAEARDLLARGRTCDRPFNTYEIAQVLKLAGRHPAKLQIAASELYLAKENGGAADARVWQRAYQRQVEYIFGKQPAPRSKALNWLRSGWHAFDGGVLVPLGRWALELLKRENVSTATARITGLLSSQRSARCFWAFSAWMTCKPGSVIRVCTVNPGDCKP